MTVRATARGDARTSLDQTEVDVLICGASFAGLAVARELAGTQASVLVVDRYEIGERATSACAAPTPWLHAMGVAQAISQEIPCMRFSTPYGSYRYRLPWSWSSFDYRKLCELLYQQSDARFETAKVQGRLSNGARDSGQPIAISTDRGVIRAGLVDALGWRRVLGAQGYQPPGAPLSRGLEVHPEGDGQDLDVWIERSLIRRGYGWRVPAWERSGWVLAHMLRLITYESPPSVWLPGCRSTPLATKATGFPIVCVQEQKTGCSLSGTPPGIVSRSLAREYAQLFISVSPAEGSWRAFFAQNNRASKLCLATPSSVSITVAFRAGFDAAALDSRITAACPDFSAARHEQSAANRPVPWLVSKPSAPFVCGQCAPTGR